MNVRYTVRAARIRTARARGMVTYPPLTLWDDPLRPIRAGAYGR